MAKREAALTRGDLDFAIDRGQVGVDGARTDDEMLGDLGVGESFRYETKYFDPALGCRDR
jgi:hypothetical protein